MKKTIYSILLTGFIIAFGSCATLFAPKTNALSVTSEPKGAEVVVNGVPLGKTPVVLDLKPRKDYTIEYRMPGYQPVTKVVNSSVRPLWIVLDVVAGVVPVIVDAATGSWYQLDQDAIDAKLQRQP